jgi:soluble lytic murein transglycosylase
VGAAAGSGVSDVPALPAPPNAAVIRALAAAEFYDQALDELRYAQRVYGNSSVIEATFAWIYTQQARSATSTEQFNLLRGAINAMKRAYPHYLAAGGEDLPVELLRIIFPIAYWDLIQKYSAENNLDPYLAAALIAQESTFVADIKSYANAVGLTQLMAPTARQYARLLNITYTPKVLTTPDLNLRVGLKYLATKIREFGGVHLALASYNAGERPVHRWVNERPGLPTDEFIDDIPYPQTQNYVKKLLATTEDYRRLYGPDAPTIELASAATTQAPRAGAAPKPKKKAAPPARKPSTTAKKTKK